MPKIKKPKSLVETLGGLHVDPLYAENDALRARINLATELLRKVNREPIEICRLTCFGRAYKPAKRHEMGVTFYQIEHVLDTLMAILTGESCIAAMDLRRCRVCGCTDDDCRQCIEASGQPCHWVAFDLCSRCVEAKVKQ